MRQPSLLRNFVFRLTLAYAAAFGGSVVVLLGFLYLRTSDVLDAEADATIAAEAEGLSVDFRDHGLAGMVHELRERLADERGRNTIYLLVDADGTPVAGNLSNWPREVRREGPWVLFDLRRFEGGGTEQAAARARVFDLPNGLRLLVGRDLRERVAFERAMLEALAWALAASATLGLGGGYLLARRVLRRIRAIERTAASIVGGDLGRRIPLVGRDDEFDRLSARLNDMLAEIERLMSAMREVSDNVAHDLRRPLTRLKGRLEVALLDLAHGNPGRDAIESAIADTDILLATFNALLAIARAEATTPETMEDFDLGQVVHDAVELYRPLAEEKAIVLAYDRPPAVSVRGHPHLLAQALVNMLDNAVTYTPEGGRIGVQVARHDGRAAVTVADNGPGIPEADRARAVRRFVRLDPARSAEGSGLGLSLVDTVAKLHKGTLRLDDNRPGLKATLEISVRG